MAFLLPKNNNKETIPSTYEEGTILFGKAGNYKIVDPLSLIISKALLSIKLRHFCVSR